MLLKNLKIAAAAAALMLTTGAINAQTETVSEEINQGPVLAYDKETKSGVIRDAETGQELTFITPSDVEVVVVPGEVIAIKVKYDTKRVGPINK